MHRRSFFGSQIVWLFIAVTALGIAADRALANKKGKPGGDGGSEYTLVRLAPPGVAVSASYGFDLDGSGSTVGYYESGGQSFGFHFDLNRAEWLHFGAGIKVFGLNNHGEMVGVDESTGEGLYWESPVDQHPVALAPLPGHQATRGLKVNDAGMIIGHSTGAGFSVAVAWAVDDLGQVSAPVELPWAVGDTRGSIADLNESVGGVIQVVGYSGANNPLQHALRWEVANASGAPVLLSGPTDLGSLSGTPSGAFGINVLGDVVGESGGWPFFKPDGQPMRALAGIRKATSGAAGSLNDVGVIVGSQAYLKRGAPVFKAVIWKSADSVDDLNGKVNLGAAEALEDASRINNAGHILGSGYFPGITSDGDVGFLLVPTQ